MNKITYGILALLLGGFGAHHFYVHNWLRAIICLLFAWTCIPALVGIVLGAKALGCTDEEFRIKFTNL